MNSSTFTSLSLKLIGIIFILSSLLDYAIAATDFRLDNFSSQITFVTTIVDRGIIPLLGMALVLLGYWIDSYSGTPAKGPGLRLPIFGLAAFLGLIFILCMPLHFSNLNRLKTEALEQIQQGTTQGEDQIKTRLAQINALSQNPQLLEQQISQLNQIITTGEYQGREINAQAVEQARQSKEQLQALRDLTKKPQEFQKKLKELQNQWQTQLAETQRNNENQAKAKVLKEGLRIGFGSLMLAIGYIAIGWLGFRNIGGMGGSKVSRTKPKAQ